MLAQIQSLLNEIKSILHASFHLCRNLRDIPHVLGIAISNDPRGEVETTTLDDRNGEPQLGKVPCGHSEFRLVTNTK